MENTTNTNRFNPTQNYLWFPVTCLLVSLLGFLSNAVVCVVQFKQIHKKPYTRRYSLSLALGNMIYSIAGMTYYPFWPAVTFVTQGMCTVQILSSVFGYYVTIGSLLLLAAERVCAIRFPIYYRKLTKPRNVRIQLSLAWVWSAVLTIYPVIEYKVITIPNDDYTLRYCSPSNGSTFEIYFLVFNLLLPLTNVVGLTVWAICVLRKRASVAVLRQASVRSGKNETSLTKSRLHLTFIVVMFVFCFGPYVIYALVALAAPWINQDGVGQSFNYAVIILTYLHTWLNPIMQFVCVASFRRALIGLFDCGKGIEQEVSRDTGIPVTIS